MNIRTLETTDIFRGAFLLCRGADLCGIRICREPLVGSEVLVKSSAPFETERFLRDIHTFLSHIFSLLRLLTFRRLDVTHRSPVSQGILMHCGGRSTIDGESSHEETRAICSDDRIRPEPTIRGFGSCGKKTGTKRPFKVMACSAGTNT